MTGNVAEILSDKQASRTHQQENAMNAAPQPPRPALAAAEIAAVFMLVIGLCVGLTERTSLPTGGVQCGSVFGDGSSAAVCDGVLSAPTVWTWLLIVVGVLVLLAGQVVNMMARMSTHATTTTV